VVVEFSDPLPCFKCGAQPERAFKDEPRQPFGATVFTSRGHYGSTVFDEAPYSRRFLELNVCDGCLKTNVDRVVLGTPVEVRSVDYAEWRFNGEDEDDDGEG
jgi:hypothetical protein